METSVELKQQLEQAISQINNATTIEELTKIKQTFTGKQSLVANTSAQMGKLPPEEKGEIGKAVAGFHQSFSNTWTNQLNKIKAINRENELKSEASDISAFLNDQNFGARHPLSKLQEDMTDFFVSIGWMVRTGPEIEREAYNFDALNFPPSHPARYMQDTLYVEEMPEVSDEKKEYNHLLLRTHTSPMQVRSALQYGPPLYLASLGRVYRNDELDQTHTPVFHQCEGLVIDTDITMGDLVNVLNQLSRHLFGENAKTRLRPSYFPFTEPSGEFDVWFEYKSGGPGWIEVGGCGMVHPNVLENMKIDPEKYSGYAFGLGVERILQLRHSVLDMHDMVEGDVRFSRQWSNQGGLISFLDGKMTSTKPSEISKLNNCQKEAK